MSQFICCTLLMCCTTLTHRRRQRGGRGQLPPPPQCPGFATPAPNKNTVIVLCLLVVPVLTSANPVPADKRLGQSDCIVLTASECERGTATSQYGSGAWKPPAVPAGVMRTVRVHVNQLAYFRRSFPPHMHGVG